jgi:hypothetical protein
MFHSFIYACFGKNLNYVSLKIICQKEKFVSEVHDFERKGRDIFVLAQSHELCKEILSSQRDHLLQKFFDRLKGS